jgi:hypothetical protein
MFSRSEGWDALCFDWRPPNRTLPKGGKYKQTRRVDFCGALGLCIGHPSLVDATVIDTDTRTRG